jgi:hypothetical protein
MCYAGSAHGAWLVADRVIDLLRQRSLAARHEKARRVELMVAAPGHTFAAHDSAKTDFFKKLELFPTTAFDDMLSQHHGHACGALFSHKYYLYATLL